MYRSTVRDNHTAGDQRGFTLIEALISLALATIMFSATLMILRPAIEVTSLAEQRGEMQQNARVAVNFIARELSIAGTGIPMGGVQLPAGNGSVPPRFACGPEVCYLEGAIFYDNRLYSVAPHAYMGPYVQGGMTDVVTLVYRDETFKLDQYSLVRVNRDGTEITVDPATYPPITDPVNGIRSGDVLIVCNVNGCGAGVVTALDSTTTIRMDPGDPLHFNQTGAEYGNIKSLANPGTDGEYPPTRAFRVNLVTYFIDASRPDNPKLMRQVNAHEAFPVSEFIESLKFTYDVFDDDTSITTANLPDTYGRENQIRKINIEVKTRSQEKSLYRRKYDRTAIKTSVSARNLTFRDRYE